MRRYSRTVDMGPISLAPFGAMGSQPERAFIFRYHVFRSATKDSLVRRSPWSSHELRIFAVPAEVYD